MSRQFKGEEAVGEALQVLCQTKSLERYRQAQAVVLPLRYGLSLEKTAEALGITPSWVSCLRNRFIQGRQVSEAPRRGRRHHALLTYEEEVELLRPFLEEASRGHILVVGRVKAELEALLQRSLVRSWVYALLHRHGWRKLAPDKRHSQSDLEAQDAWEKLPETLTQIRDDFAPGVPIRLMFQDEVRFGRITDIRRAWAPFPLRPMGQGHGDPRIHLWKR
jgi:transposase